MKITYDPLIGVAVPDARVDQWVYDAVNTSGDIVVGTRDMVDQFRLLRASGAIAELIIVFNGVNLVVDKHGRLSKWPKGFCNHTTSRVIALATYGV